MLEPTFTPHALERFAQRFPNLDIRAEWLTAINSKGLNKLMWNHVRRNCPLNGERYMSQWRMFKGIYYKLSKGGVVFVIRPPMEVVTVLRVPEPEKAKNSLDNWVKVPGTDYVAIHCGKLPSQQFKRILKAGNEMYTYIREHRPDLADEWLASIQPADKYQKVCLQNGPDNSATASDESSKPVTGVAF